MDNKLNKWVLVTGVSSGIGLCIANHLANQGYQVIGCLRDLSNKPSELNQKVRLISMDQADESSIANASIELNKIINGQKLYALINNAGIAVPGPLVDLPLDKFREQLEVNVFGVLSLTQKLFPMMTDGSRIINIGSVSGLLVSPFMGAYCCSKYSIEAMSDALRRELMLLGIKVVIIEPGPLKTQIWNKNLGLADQYKDSIFHQYLLKADDTIAETERNALAVDAIIDPIMKAISHPNPKNRYLVHKSPFLFRLVSSLLPSKILDRMIAKNLKSTNNKIRPV